MEESTDEAKPGKLFVGRPCRDSDDDGVPDFADGIGLPAPIGPATGNSEKCGDEKAKLVEMKVRLETPIDPEKAEVVFDYASFASIPREGADGDIVVAGGGTNTSLRTYHLKKTGLRIWAVDAKMRDGTIDASKDVNEPGGKFIPPGKTIKWSDIAKAAAGGTTGVTPRSLTLYLEYVTSAPAPGQTQTKATGQKKLICTEINAVQSGGIAKDTVNLALLEVELRDIQGAGEADDRVIHTMQLVPSQKNGEEDPDFWRRRNAYFQQQIPEESIAYIEPHRAEGNSPDMPRLVARLLGGNQSLKVKWRMEVEYLRGNGYRASYIQDFARPEDKILLPGPDNSLSFTPEMEADQEWRIFESQRWVDEIQQRGFFGGSGKLYLWCPGQDQSVEPNLTFRIGGRNPDQNFAREFIDSR